MPNEPDTSDESGSSTPPESTSTDSPDSTSTTSDEQAITENTTTDSTNTTDTTLDTGSEPREKQSDEQFCSSCGELIKKEAEICPECGVRQSGTPSNSNTDFQLQQKQRVANKDITTVMLVSFLVTPVGYYMVGKTMLALINLITFNYFLLGWFIVPFHTRKIIKDTRDELAAQGH